MKYYIINKEFLTRDIFLKLEDIAFDRAAINKYVLFKVFYSELLEQNIFINLN